jgi:hypothetical protein
MGKASAAMYTKASTGQLYSGRMSLLLVTVPSVKWYKIDQTAVVPYRMMIRDVVLYVQLGINQDKRHYDRQNSQMSYVYSLYLHLRNGSAQVALNDTVVEGQWIAEVDDTGRSGGHHLHLQLVVSPNANGQIEPTNTIQSEQNSRNPELWLMPYPANSATAVGLVTDSNGNLMGNVIICGMVKSAAGYQWSRTYSHPDLNRDDILVENFATTDVLPGTYHVRAYNLADTCGTTPLVKDFGNQTFQAGKTTYIGLYPTYLPLLREGGNWHSTVFVRNNGTSSAKVDTTFFNTNGWVSAGNSRTDTLAPSGMIAIPVPWSFQGSAIIVGSQDISVVAQVEYCPSTCEPAGYNALTPSTGVGTAGWEKVGTTIFVPLVKNQYYGRSSQLSIANVGTDVADFSISYYASNGNVYTGGTWLDQEVNGAITTRVADWVPGGGYYSAKIHSTNAQPLAVVVREGEGNPPLARPAIYNGLSSSSYTLYAPMVKKEYPYTGGPSQSTTGITIQNATASPPMSQRITTTWMEGLWQLFPAQSCRIVRGLCLTRLLSQTTFLDLCASLPTSRLWARCPNRTSRSTAAAG